MKHFPPLLLGSAEQWKNECKAGHQAGTGSVQRSVQGQWPAWCLRNIFHPSFLGSFLGNRVSTRLRARSVCRLAPSPHCWYICPSSAGSESFLVSVSMENETFSTPCL
jgi:hypothetical protein